jgi:hypothetical protein
MYEAALPRFNNIFGIDQSHVPCPPGKRDRICVIQGRHQINQLVSVDLNSIISKKSTFVFGCCQDDSGKDHKNVNYKNGIL